MLETLEHGDVREIRLARPPANALNPELVARFTDTIAAAGETASAVVVSGREGMFSGGLDVPELLRLDRDQMTDFWRMFLKMLRTIAFMPVPTVFALTGHAPAGGIVMALYGDYRIMPKGKFKTGLNEVQVGLVVSSVIHQALVRAVGPRTAERILVAGEMMEAGKAREIGLVDELADTPADVVPRAVEWCEQHLSLPRQAMLTMRYMARRDLRGLFEAEGGMDPENFLEIWFSGETRNTLEALVERLTKR